MDLVTEDLVLRAKPPFSLVQSFKFIERFHGPRFGLECDDDHLRRAGLIEGEVFLVNITPGPADLDVRCEITKHGKVSTKLKNEVASLISDYLSLDEDLTEFYRMAEDDPVLSHIVQNAYGYHQARFFTPFESVIWSIITQRFPVDRSRTIMDNIAASIGGSIDFKGHHFLAFPEAHTIVSNKEKLSSLISNHRKREYILSAAEAFENVDPEFLRSGPYDKVFAWLEDIKGIGDWSASLIMIRGLGRLERATLARSIPKERVLEYYRQNGDHRSLEEIAEQYGRYQGLWEHYVLYWMD